MDDSMDDSPEVTISPADNGHVVRWYQRGTKKDDSGRTVKRVAMSKDEALEHAGEALGGSGKSSKKKIPSRSVGRTSPDAGEESSAPAAHSGMARAKSARRRPRSLSRRA